MGRGPQWLQSDAGPAPYAAGEPYGSKATQAPKILMEEGPALLRRGAGNHTAKEDPTLMPPGP